MYCPGMGDFSSGAGVLAGEMPAVPLGLAGIPAVVVAGSDLLKHVNQVFARNALHKQTIGIVDQLNVNLRDFLSKYDSVTETAIVSSGQAAIFVPGIATKCNAACAWLVDVFSNEQDKTWTLQPSPVSELPAEQMLSIVRAVMSQIPEGQDPREMIEELTERARERVQVQAAKAAKSREAVLHDQLIQGGFRDAFATFLWDLVVSKAGILKGPVLKYVNTKHWEAPGQLTLSWEPRPTFSAVSPLDAYPSPDDTNFDGDFVEIIKMLPGELEDLKGIEGYQKENIEKLIEGGAVAAATPAIADGAQERATSEDKATPGLSGSTSITTAEPNKSNDRIDVRNSWVRVKGSVLLDVGVARDLGGEDLVPERSYDAEVLHTEAYLLFAGINPDPLGRKPYTKMGWSQRPGSFWYDGLPEKLHDLQRVVNASVRSLVYNMGFSSGPQTVLTDIDRLPDGADITTQVPNKLWQFSNRRNSNVPPLLFTQPESNANELQGVYDYFSKQLDDHSGVPAYWYGNDNVAGAGRTASGLSMLMSNSAKGIKRVVLAIDQKVFRPLIERMYDWNLLYRPEEFAGPTGDVEVVPMGAVALMAKEAMADRRMSFLQATANEQDMKVMGLRGRARVLREAAKTLEMPGEEVVRSDEELAVLEKQGQEAVQAQQQGEAAQIQAEAQSKQQEGALRVQEAQVQLQIKQMELQIKQAELQLEVQRFQAETALKSRRQEFDARSQAAALQHTVEKDGVAAEQRERELGMREMAAVTEAEGAAADAAVARQSESS